MKSKERKICLVVVLICVLPLLLLTACRNDSLVDYKSDYHWVYDPEFTDECDDFMSIDGKLDEDVWTSEKRSWMSFTEAGTTLRYTTFFTAKGLYIAAHVQDTEIIWSGRFNYAYYTGDRALNSAFMFFVAGPDETNLQIFSQYTFAMDTKNCCSYEVTHFTGKAVANGDVENGEATEMTAELFITWDALNIEVNPATGMPDKVCIIPRYRHIGDVTDPKQNYWIEPLYSDRYSLYSYATFNQNGYLSGEVTGADNAIWGNSPVGTSHSYGWDLSNVAEGVVQSTAPGSQAIFLSNPDAYSDRYIFSVSMRMDSSIKGTTGSNGFLRAGICNSTNSKDLVAVYLDAVSLENGIAKASRLCTDPWTQKDDYASCNLAGYDYNASNQTVRLTVMKDGGHFYYLVEDKLLAVTYESAMSGKTFPGVYTLSTQATFFDPQFTDYSENLEEFNDILEKYVYRVTVPSNTKGGSISINTVGVDNTLTKPTVAVSFVPNNGYILSGFTVNGQSTINGMDSLSFIAQNIQGNTIELPLSSSVVLDVKYSKIDELAETVTIRGEVKSVDGTHNLPGASVLIRDKTNPLFFAVGKTSTQGRFEFEFMMPKEGGYQIDGQLLSPGGSYEITVAPGPNSTSIIAGASLADMDDDGYILVEMQAKLQMEFVYLVSNSEKSPAILDDDGSLTITALKEPASFISLVEGISTKNHNTWIASADIYLNQATDGSCYMDKWNTYGFGLKFGANEYLTIGASIRGAEGLKLAYMNGGDWGGQLNPNADATAVEHVRATYTESDRLNIKLWYKDGSYAIYLNNVLFGTYTAEKLGFEELGEPIQVGYGCRLDDSLPKAAAFGGISIGLEGSDEYNAVIGCTNRGHIWDHGTVVKQPSCTEVGKKMYTCTKCKATSTEIIKQSHIDGNGDIKCDSCGTFLMKSVYLASNAEKSPFEFNDDSSLSITATEYTSFISLYDGDSLSNQTDWIVSTDIFLNKSYAGYYLDTWNTYGIGLRYGGNTYLTIGASIRGTKGLKLAYLKNGDWGGQLESNADATAVQLLRATYPKSDRLNIKLWYTNGSYAIYLNNVLYGTYTAEQLGVAKLGEPVQVGYGCRLDDSLPKTATFGAITVARKGTAKYYELVTK